MKQEVRIFDNTNEISEAIASMLKDLSKVKTEKSIHIALSGGSTPKEIFKYLTLKYGKELIDPRFNFWWGDERCVSPNNDESNYYWANKLWLSPCGVKPQNIHRIMGENSPTEEAIRYAIQIETLLEKNNGVPQFDLVILGIGDDGHTASIFPNQMELLKSEQLCEVASHPISGQKRVTFTGKLINNSKTVVFLSTGKNKALKTHQIVDLKDKSLPATHVRTINGNLIWIIDNEAAQKLKKR